MPVAVDAAAVALAKVSLVNGEGGGGNAGEGGGMVDSKANASGINESCKVDGVFCSPHIGADSVEGFLRESVRIHLIFLILLVAILSCCIFYLFILLFFFMCIFCSVTCRYFVAEC